LLGRRQALFLVDSFWTVAVAVGSIQHDK
jgi:hypothetical protein